MYRILLVDDEQNVINALRRELQSDYGPNALPYRPPFCRLAH